ncbi:MAG: glycine cleavage system regulatory protein [Candidatus Azotimanducaceae bacterium]|jgi:glycine cleavage system regulatory protein
MNSLVFTIIGDDRQGVVEQIANVVNDHEANWLGSRMSQLAGKFAGMIEVAGDESQLAALSRALESLEGLRVVVETGAGETKTSESTAVVTILGLDRPGIVREVSMALRSASLNVLELTTSVSQAAMTGGLLFNGRALVDTANGDMEELAQKLEEASLELGVDIEIVEPDN